MVVDDEPALADYIAKVLAPCGYDIRGAYGGEKAVSIAKGFRPDCIVTGIMMPRMDGIQEAIAILQFLPSCKFVFVSGNSHSPSIREAYARLGWDFRLLLPKPFERSELLNAIALAGFPCAGMQGSNTVRPKTWDDSSAE